jgi:hypothetical protein
LTKPLLAGLFRKVPRGGKGGARLLDSPNSARGDDLMNVLAAAGVEPTVTLTRRDGSRAMNIETQSWRNGTTTILALQRERNESTEPEPVLLTLRDTTLVYDLRAGILRGTTKSLDLMIDPVVPTLLVLSVNPGSTPAISGASRVVAGRTATMTFGLRQGVGRGSDVTILRVEVVNPRGEVVPARSANVLLRGASIAKRFAFETDSSGSWRIRATDVLTGNSASKDVEVVAE